MFSAYTLIDADPPPLPRAERIRADGRPLPRKKRIGRGDRPQTVSVNRWRQTPKAKMPGDGSVRKNLARVRVDETGQYQAGHSLIVHVRLSAPGAQSRGQKTTAGYRADFLRWCRKGKVIVGGRVQPAGITAIGVGAPVEGTENNPRPAYDSYRVVGPVESLAALVTFLADDNPRYGFLRVAHWDVPVRVSLIAAGSGEEKVRPSTRGPKAKPSRAQELPRGVNPVAPVPHAEYEYRDGAYSYVPRR